MSKYSTDKVVTLNGKEYILFEGLLECAHAEYDLLEVDTKIIQLPNEENGHNCIFQATVVTKDGRKFSATGDANPENVNSKIAKHIIRMAETRAVGRALRFLTGFGTVFEELGDLETEASQKAEVVNISETNPAPAPATKAQLNKIKKDAETLGLSVEEVYQKFEISGEPSKEEASKIIKWLKTDEAKAAVTPF